MMRRPSIVSRRRQLTAIDNAADGQYCTLLRITLKEPRCLLNDREHALALGFAVHGSKYLEKEIGALNPGLDDHRRTEL